MYSVFLDTNIYRSLGLRFSKHRDYEYLNKFLNVSGNEFGIIKIVEEELLDYYRKDVFGKLFTEHQRLIKLYEDNPYLRKLPMPNFEVELKAAMEILENEVIADLNLEVVNIPTNLLTKFLLFNKAERRADNARDFLIFYNLIMLCEQNPEETVTIISQDKIFRYNEFFLNELKIREISNFKVYESIPSFLAEVGVQVDWLTKEIIDKSIDSKVISKELLEDITCLPSYVSEYYYRRDGDDLPSIEKLEIKGYHTKDFYVHKDEVGKLIVSADVVVSVNALFGDDPNPEALMHFLQQKPTPTISKPETFDHRGRVIYSDDVLFLFEGEINENNKSLENFHFIDFMPSYFRYENWTPGPAYKLLAFE